MAAPTKSKSEHAKPADLYRVPREGGFQSAWKVAAVLAVVGLGASFVARGQDEGRFAFSWLFAFMTFLALGLGSLWFVVIQHLTKAAWSVTLRRTSEMFAAGLPVFALLFWPIYFSADSLYPWVGPSRAHEESAVHASPAADGEADEGEGDVHSSAEGLLGASTALAQDHDGSDHDGSAHDGSGHGAGGHAEGGHAAGAHGHSPEHAAHEDSIEAKLAFLDEGFFAGRAVLYLLLWAGLAYFFVRSSVDQDSSKDLAISRKLHSWAPLSMFAFALSLTFAAFDWMMSLEPAWYSTIFGVQYFAVGVVSSLSVLIVTANALKNAGVLGDAVHTEHFHDAGKLLFGFLVFWAYISFSQFMLIWYAGIPEEATYYHLRWEGGWRTYSLFMAVAHFVIPFFLLISRNVKRRVPMLAFGAAWLLVMHVVEVYWLVMPYASGGGLDVQWMDVAALFGVGGVYLSVVFFLMTRVPLVPVGDPRLARALHHEVV